MNGIQFVAKVESNMKNSLIRFCSKKSFDRNGQ